MKIKEVCGYDDFMLNTWFELGGFAGSEIEDQMRCFAEEVMPVLERECGGRAELPREHGVAGPRDPGPRVTRRSDGGGTR